MVDLKNISKHDFGQVFEYQHSTFGDCADYVEGCRKAAEYNCRVIFASPFFAKEMLDVLKGTNTMLGGGASFPLGVVEPSIVKAHCVEEYVKLGFQVMDVVINQHAVKIGKWDFVKNEFKMLRSAAAGVELKIIMEVCNLTNDEIKHVCELIAETGIDFAKTSTGRMDGPRMDQIEVIRDTLKGSDVKMKVAGIKAPRPQNAMAFLKAGVDVLGSQRVFEIIDSLDLMRRMNQI
ncbi:MAG: deoxyribose-phosphate aldolase [Oscillospiraceae bacterium]